MAKAASKKFNFWHSHQGYALEVIVALLLSYSLASRAIDTGSLIQYFATFVLLGFAINRTFKIVKKKK